MYTEPITTTRYTHCSGKIHGSAVCCHTDTHCRLAMLTADREARTERCVLYRHTDGLSQAYHTSMQTEGFQPDREARRTQCVVMKTRTVSESEAANGGADHEDLNSRKAVQCHVKRHKQETSKNYMKIVSPVHVLLIHALELRNE